MRPFLTKLQLIRFLLYVPPPKNNCGCTRRIRPCTINPLFGGEQYYRSDHNKDGEVTFNELAASIRVYKKNQEAYIRRYVTARLKQLDRNKDGRVIYC